VGIDFLIQEPQVEIEVDLAAAERFQIKPGDVRRSTATLLSGLQVGSLYEQQKVFDVIVWGREDIRENLTDIENLMIDTPGGGHILLNEVADVRIVPAPLIIKRDAVSRFIDLTVEVSGRGLGSVAADIEVALDGFAVPFEYHAEVLSDYAEQQDTQQRILVVSLIVVFGSFLILQAAFRSWHLAAFTLLTWPLTLSGGVIAIVFSNATLSLGSLLGFLAVLAIAIRNSVIMVGHYQHLEDDGGFTFGSEVVLRGAGDRARSILMTALGTGLAFLPLLIFGNIAGLEILNPMAVVVIGGLITSTLLNLFLLPILYLRFGEKREPDPGLSPVEVAGD
jgi:Cu/Ag efflux pump CusA